MLHAATFLAEGFALPHTSQHRETPSDCSYPHYLALLVSLLTRPPPAICGCKSKRGGAGDYDSSYNFGNDAGMDAKPRVVCVAAVASTACIR
jgi:hypothetical protein